MSDSGQQNNEPKEIPENAGDSINWVTVKNSKSKAASSTLQDDHLLPQIRKRKVLKVRHQLSEGKYDIGMRLNVVIDRLLEDILV